MEQSREGNGASVIAGRETAEVLGMAEAALDPVAVEAGVVRNDDPAGGV